VRQAAARFVYDALGRRAGKTIGVNTTQFVYDGLNPVQELDGANPANVTANLLTGLNIDEYFTRADSNGAMDFLTDALGSTLALADSSGAINTSYTYEPFGNTTIGGSNPNPYQFTGRENDGTGLQYNRTRYYSPSLQRFISQDPIGFAGGDTNLYAYGSNDPANLIDPLGLDAYICQRRLNFTGAPPDICPFCHEFVCVVRDGATHCFGLTTDSFSPSHPFRTTPGTFEPDTFNNSCKRQSTKRCVDTCLLGTAEQSAPNYNLVNLFGGMNCQKFASSAVTNCEAKCANSSE
jgi:RHS repeat-associated protein